jgi:hypothetical protein
MQMCYRSQGKRAGNTVHRCLHKLHGYAAGFQDEVMRRKFQPAVGAQTTKSEMRHGVIVCWSCHLPGSLLLGFSRIPRIVSRGG